MDEPQLSAEAQSYRCPGAAYTIDRAQHLSRLATFYPSCRTCEHRHETHSLSTRQVAQLAEIEQRRQHGPRFTAEAFSADSPGAMDQPSVARLATSLGVLVARDAAAAAPGSVVAVGTDGHWTSAEHLATACEALARTGCRTLEVGAVSAAALVGAIEHTGAAAGLWIGNASGEPHATNIKVWGAGGRPWSNPGTLASLAEVFATDADRPRRRGGGALRHDATQGYLQNLQPMYFGLRPLRFVLDTCCTPLASYLTTLGRDAACEALRPGRSSQAGEDWRARLAERVGRAVVAQRAHFGVWIDGDGECCRFVDERGELVAGERLLLRLAHYVAKQRPGATILLGESLRGHAAKMFADAGIRHAFAADSREAMFDALRGNPAAVLGGDANGRVWFTGQPPVADALLTLSLWLTIQSQTDGSCTEILSEPVLN